MKDDPAAAAPTPHSRVVVAVHEHRFEEVEARLAARDGLLERIELTAVGADGSVAGAAARAEVFWRPVATSTGWMARVVDRLPALRWFHTDSVGIDTLPLDLIAARGVVLTNGVGIYSRPMAEWVVLSMLAAAKRLPDFMQQSAEAIWHQGPTLAELEHSVVLLVGLGSVNSLVARLLVPFGAEVRAVVRTRRTRPAGVDRLVPFANWREELAEADHLVLAVPLTAATRNLLDADAFGRLKPGATLINVARGELINDRALLAALEAGRVRAAVLDAFAEEPLPPSSPLWRRPDVLVVPHFTWSSPAIVRRRTDLFADQLEAWLAGGSLGNRVEVARGY